MRAHEHAEQLIPWLVNGTLGEADMARVQRHLADCEVCRSIVDRELRLARKLHRAVDDSRLTALIANQDEHLAALRARLPASAPRWKTPRRSIPAFAALLVLAVPVAFVATNLAPPETERIFEARTTTMTTARPVLQLIFAPNTSAEDIALVIAASGSVIGEPSQHGVYRIALATDRPDELLLRLREHPAVRWAEIEL